MPTKPIANQPEFFVTDPANRIEPSGPKKEQGYVPKEPLPAQIFNWLMYSISLWIAYLVEKTDATDNGVGSQPAQFSGGYTEIDSDSNGVTYFSYSSGFLEFQLPDPTGNDGLVFTIKDADGGFEAIPVLVHPFAGDTIEGLNESYELASAYGSWTFFCNGFDWVLI